VRRSRLEPTCWALLATAAMGAATPDVSALRRWMRQDGWLVDAATLPPNAAFNAVAAIALGLSPADAALADALVGKLVVVKGATSAQFPELRQNNSLEAWSWISGTASWVEPTAWCVLALKHRQAHVRASIVRERIRAAEDFLVDRACVAGGWNYGNPNVYGTDLIPHVPTTALGLLALQDQRHHPVVARALTRLQADAPGERSHLALALAILCLRVYGVGVSELTSTLTDWCAARLQRNDPGENLLGIALALCALSDTPAAMAPFTIRTTTA
jgi:hypothetical protein